MFGVCVAVVAVVTEQPCLLLLCECVVLFFSGCSRFGHIPDYIRTLDPLLVISWLTQIIAEELKAFNNEAGRFHTEGIAETLVWTLYLNIFS